ncbi:MAG: FAD-dependent monooxygenase [Afipia sp.]|nr:MAG: FAD-dependent monooxygenase [Afipia sp.]
MRGPLDISVVGAGVAGLAIAAILAKAGHRVVVFERFATSLPLGSGLMLQPTGLAALERLGLRSKIEALGHRIDRLHGITDTNRTIFDLAYAGLDQRFHAVAVHRALLHGVLWDNFKTCGAALETGQSVTGVAPQAGGKVKLITATDTLPGTFDLVIDASGANSLFRPTVSSNTARGFSYGAVWASIPDLGISDGCLSQRYVSARRMIGYLPVGRIANEGPSLAALFWSLKPAEYSVWRANFEPWRAEAIALWPELTSAISALNGPDDLALASYVHYTAPRPFKGPLALIGDAAHATSPQLGQGANNGLLDAITLSDAIATSSDLPSALGLYAKTRRGHVRFYQMASALMTPFFQSDSGGLAALRDLTFDRMKFIPYLRREMLRTLAGLKTGLFTHAAPERLAGCVDIDVRGVKTPDVADEPAIWKEKA